MRSLPVLLCLAVSFPIARPVAAQPQPVIRGGVRAGVLLSDLPNLADAFKDAGADTSLRYTFTFGGQVSLRLTDALAFQPEAFYAPKGLRGTDPQGRDFQIRLAYVDVPLLVRLHRSSTQGPYAFAGPSFNVNVSAKVYEVGDGIPLPYGDGTSRPFNLDIKDSIRLFEAGLVAGAGIQIGIVAVEGRFIEGLTSVVSNAGDGGPTRNRSVAILAGVPFP